MCVCRFNHTSCLLRECAVLILKVHTPAMNQPVTVIWGAKQYNGEQIKAPPQMGQISTALTKQLTS